MKNIIKLVIISLAVISATNQALASDFYNDVDARAPMGMYGCRMDAYYTQCIDLKMEEEHKKAQAARKLQKAKDYGYRKTAVTAAACMRGASALAETSGRGNVDIKNRRLGEVRKFKTVAIRLFNYDGIPAYNSPTFDYNGPDDVERFVQWLLFDTTWPAVNNTHVTGRVDTKKFISQWWGAWDESMRETRNTIKDAMARNCDGRYEDDEDILKDINYWKQEWLARHLY